VEEIFGWMKTVELLSKARYRGVARRGWMFTGAAVVYNLVWMRTLAAVAQTSRRMHAHDPPDILLTASARRQ